MGELLTYFQNFNYVQIYFGTVVLNAMTYLMMCFPVYIIVNSLKKNQHTMVLNPKNYEPQQIQSEIKSSLLSILIFGFNSVIIRMLLDNQLIQFRQDLNGLRIAGEVLLFLVWNEIHFFCAHRLLHTRLFYKFHKEHHKISNISPFAIFRFHPIEAFLLSTVIPLMTLMLNIHMESVIIFVLISMTLNIIGHSGLDLFSSWLSFFHFSKRHFLHHKFHKMNFGFLVPYFDQVLKTDQMKSERKNDEKYIFKRSQKYINQLSKWLSPLLDFVFRIEVNGLQNILEDQPCLLVANHNSGALVESHSLLFLLKNHKKEIYGLNHRALFKIPFVSQHFEKIGAVPADLESAQRTLGSGHHLIVFPGGQRQVFRPFSSRHDHTFSWAQGWAKIPQETHAPVVPIKFIGTHALNPIFFNSKILSNLLVLPKLLKVSTFPVSLAQILFLGLSILVGYQLQLNLWSQCFVSYLAFCFSVLIPVVPYKIKIMIYPPILDYTDSSDLKTKIDAVMAEKDYPARKNINYPLNGIEKFMLYNESEKVNFNSQFVFDFEGSLDKDCILQTTEKWIKAVPQARSILLNSKYYPRRKVYEKAWFKAQDIVFFENYISDVSMDHFSYQKFNLSFDAPVRFLFQSDGLRSRLIFSCHHSIFDGAGQAYAFEAWSKIYNGEQNLQTYENLNTFRYKSVVRKLGLFQSVKLLLENWTTSPPRKNVDVASLVTRKDDGLRKVTTETIFFDQSQVLRQNRIKFENKEEISLLILKSLQKVLNQRKKSGDIIALFPMGLRTDLKIRDSLQNAVVSTAVRIKPEEFSHDEQLKTKLNRKLSSDPVIENQKFIFGALFSCSLMPAFKIKKTLQKYDSVNSGQSSSVLIVHALMPKTFPMPKDWKNVFTSARGTLLKSPGIGFIITGNRERVTINIEYLPNLIQKSDILILKEELLYSLQRSVFHLSSARGSMNEI